MGERRKNVRNSLLCQALAMSQATSIHGLRIGPVTLHHSRMRIASLLASATEIVYELGLGDQLVAISHECDFPPEALSRPRLSRPRFDPSGLSSAEIDAAVRDSMAQ